MLSNSLVVKFAVAGMMLAACRIASADEPRREPAEPNQATASLLADYLEALDRLDLAAAERITRRAVEQAPGRPETELMVRHTRLLAAKMAQPHRAERARPTNRADKDRLYARTYVVADLVLPALPLLDPATLKPKFKLESAAADFDSLIELISSAIKPASWEAAGGAGTILPHARNLSLVVSQTQDVHEEIVDLLEQLRRANDLSLMVDAITLSISETKAPRELLDIGTRSTAILNPAETKRFIEAANLGGAVQSNRGLHLLNGQFGAFPFASSGDGKEHAVLGIQGVVSSDRGFIRLTLASSDKAVALHNNFAGGQVPDGGSVLIGLNADSDRQQVSKPDSHAEPAKIHRLLLLAPRIIIQEEEEERIDKKTIGDSDRRPALRPENFFDYTAPPFPPRR